MAFSSFRFITDKSVVFKVKTKKLFVYLLFFGIIYKGRDHRNVLLPFEDGGLY